MPQIDPDLYRRDLSLGPPANVRLSVIDIAPERPVRTILFLHGFGGEALQWQYQLWEFSDNSRVIAPDLRGHGLSDKPLSSYAMPELLEDIALALDILEVRGPLVVVGHSFGAAIAVELVHRFPERVARLVLIAGSGEYRLGAVFHNLLKLPNAVMRVAGPFTRQWLKAPPVVLKRFYHNNMRDWHGWQMLRSLPCPTLVIRGNRDRILNPEHFEEVARVVPDCEEVDVSASAHLVMLERRDAVNRAIESFVAGRKHRWRDDDDVRELAALHRDRPWLSQYESNVPRTIAIPRVPLYQLLQSAAQRFPLRPVIFFQRARLTYRRIDQETNRFANALRGMGVRPGDRVMVLLPNLPQTVVAIYGALKAGATAVLTSPRTDRAELLRELRETDTQVLVLLTNEHALAQAALAETGVRHIIFTNVKDYLPVIDWIRFSLFRERQEGHALPERPAGNQHLMRLMLYLHSAAPPAETPMPDSLAVIQFTGGTTSQPKGVMLSHRNLVANTLQNRHWISDADEGRERLLSVLPFTHSYGLTTALNVPISLGATMVLLPQFQLTEVLHTIRRTRPTLFPGVPRMYMAIANFPGVRRFGISTIRACLSGAAPLPVDVQESFEKLTRGRLVEGYGLTEASPVTHATPIHGRRKSGSIGVPLPNTEARIIDLASGQDLPPGQVGELAVRGPQVMQGYWGDQAATRRAINPDGWLLTGDVAQMDEQGFFYIISRKADMWYPGKPGEMAFPRDVEEVLFEIPQIEEAAVVAIANRPVAFVIARRNRPTTAAVRAYCERRLPPYLIPDAFIFVDNLPRNFIGKVIRRELIQLFKDIRSDTPTE